ncbi:MAG: hypothetical protein KC609_02645, partial [Myxococcales bacterium]|nr:hypothetical protein [Myxococcales bacterium]
HLRAGAPQEAYTTIHTAFAEPAAFESAEVFAVWFALLARIGGRIVGADFEGLVQYAVNDPDNAEALFHCGYELYEQQLFAEASCALWRAWRLAPTNVMIISELVVTLEALGENRRACDVLASTPQAIIDGDFYLGYLCAFNAVMSGEIRLFFERVRQLTPTTDEHGFLQRRIERMGLRLQALDGICPLDERDLRGWHYVLTGGLLSHLSPYGVEAMNGRYGYIQDTESRCRYGLESLASQLEAIGAQPRQILTPVGFSSRILAHAASDLLGLPLAPLADEESGLVVCYDLQTLEIRELEWLYRRGKERWVFAHASCWTTPPPFTPDLTTLLYQHNRAPWDDHLVLDPETGMPTERRTARRDAAEIGRLVRDAKAVDPAEIARDDDGTRRSIAALVGSRPELAEPETRSSFWLVGPVRSNRF